MHMLRAGLVFLVAAAAAEQLARAESGKPKDGGIGVLDQKFRYYGTKLYTMAAKPIPLHIAQILTSAGAQRQPF